MSPGDDGYLVQFQLAADGNDLYFNGAVTWEMTPHSPADLYLCACVIGEDCPSYFT